MKDQVKWFGRYLGCYSVHFLSDNVPDPTSKLKIISCTWFSIKDRKLILKELKDINDEDLTLWVKVLDNRDYVIINIRRYDSFVRIRCGIDGRVFSYSLDYNFGNTYNPLEIDLLRSKGYAIGIPKEYYITESELK